MTEFQHFPLAKAFLCLDCVQVVNAATICPCCSSRALLNLAVILNRYVPEPVQEEMSEVTK